MGWFPVKRDRLRHCDVSPGGGSEAQAHFKCGTDDRINSHSVGHHAARTMIPHSRGHRAQEGWDPSSWTGVLRPRGPTIATRLDPADLSDDRSADRLIRLLAYAFSSAPSGTTPCVTYRQSATSNLRATATIAMRLILPRLSPTLSWNHRLRALPG
jgi:hypothetical protein